MRALSRGAAAAVAVTLLGGLLCLRTAGATGGEPSESPQLTSDLLDCPQPASWSCLSPEVICQAPLPSGFICANSSQLVTVELSGVGLEGTLPASWSRFTSLQQIGLAGNHLTGTLPPEWSTLAALRNLTLGQNDLTGTLPREWSAMGAMVHIELDDNVLSGTLPLQWSGMDQLMWMGTSGNVHTGLLPSEWHNLSLLEHLILSCNRFQGSLPPEWSGLTSLRSLAVHSSSITGTLPAVWSAMSYIYELYFHNNFLRSTLPADWSALTSILELEVHGNRLSGTLPPSYSNLSSIQSIAVSSNLLTGTLPPTWSALTALKHLRLGQNAMHGDIPTQWSQLNAVVDLEVGMNMLDYVPRDLALSMPNLTIFGLGLNNLRGDKPLTPTNETELTLTYNCGDASWEQQRFCPAPETWWHLLACVAGVFVLASAISTMVQGPREAMQKAWFDLQRCKWYVQRDRIFLVVLLAAVSWSLFLLTEAFDTNVRWFSLQFVGVSPLIYISVHSLSSTLQPVASSILLLYWLFRAYRIHTIGFKPTSWTIMASQVCVRENLQVIQADQNIVHCTFLMISPMAAVFNFFAFPSVIYMAMASDPHQGFAPVFVQVMVYVPRWQLALFTYSFTLAFCSVVATLALPEKLWTCSAIHQALKLKAKQTFRVTDANDERATCLRRLGWFRQAYLASACVVFLSLGCSLWALFLYWDDFSDAQEELTLRGDPRGVLEMGTAHTVVMGVCAFVQTAIIFVWYLGARGFQYSLLWSWCVRPLEPEDEEDIPQLGRQATFARTASHSKSQVGSSQCVPDIHALSPGNVLRQFQAAALGVSRLKRNLFLAAIGVQLFPALGLADWGQAMVIISWLVTLVVILWVLLATDRAGGFGDLREMLVFGLVVDAWDLARALEEDLKREQDEPEAAADGGKGSAKTQPGAQKEADAGKPHPLSYSEGSAEEAGSDTPQLASESVESGPDEPPHFCGEEFPGGCPKCELLVRRYAASMFRMQETLAVSYRWQPTNRAIVRPTGMRPGRDVCLTGVIDGMVGINMNRWQRQQLLSALQSHPYKYVWLDALSIPAALNPERGTFLSAMSSVLLTRMMAVYAAAAATLVLRTTENEGERYHQRVWTLQEYCCSRALKVRSQEPESELHGSVEEGARLSAKGDEAAGVDEIRSMVMEKMTNAVPMWLRDALHDEVASASSILEGVLSYKEARDCLKCQQPEDFVRALLPLFLNSPVQDGAELLRLVRLAHASCEEGSCGRTAMAEAESLLDSDAKVETCVTWDDDIFINHQLETMAARSVPRMLTGMFSMNFSAKFESKF